MNPTLATPQRTITRDQIGTRREMFTEIRAKDQGRGFTGIGVPYGETIDLWGMRERFEPGSVELDRDGVPSLILWQHDQNEPIGRITAGTDTEAGFEIEAALSSTARGTEAATLLEDGVITRLSIGFMPEEYRIESDEETGTETIVHTKVRAMEFSLVSFPAYSSAAVSTVRNSNENSRKETTMETVTRADIDSALTPFNDDLEDLKRSIAALGEQVGDQAPAAPYFRDMGDYLKKIAAGDERALDFHSRATTGDVGIESETKLGTFIKFVQERRSLINLFDTGSLPAKGMSVSYAEMIEDTTTAGEQLEEMDDLDGPGQVKFDTKSAKVRTFGGWTELSRQVIERVDLPYLNTVLTALGLKYARATNAALRTEIRGVIDSQVAAENTIELPASATVFDYRDAIVDAKEIYDDRGFLIDGLLMGKADFKRLQRLTYSEVPALKVNPKDEFSGTLSLPNADGDLASMPVHTLFGGYDGPMAFYDHTAVKSLESPNAPIQLQDDNIINLSRAFSLYGYMAFIAPFPTAIVPLTTATAGA